jgi:putrescine importer
MFHEPSNWWRTSLSLATGSEPSASPVTPVQLRRVLTLWDLIFYGIVLIQPIAAVPLFGIADQLSRGHVVTTILIAMVAMTLTAFSYGKMAAVYPAAGSAYTYVGRGLNPHLGFFTGWAMILDYMLIPIINTIYGSLTLMRLFPGVPYFVWTTILVLGMTFLNLRGIQWTARANQLLLLVMCLVIAAFIILATRLVFHLDGWHGVFSTLPFYNPKTAQFSAIATATSLAALTYIGFDGVTTLSEEARNPKRDILRATVLVCVITGVLSGAEVYLAQRVWPAYSTFSNVETAFMDVGRRVGGKWMFHSLAFILIVASLGSGLAGQAGAARLLFGMGRDNALPRRIFGYLDVRRQVPAYNILLIGALTLAGALLFNFERAAELLNFGAFLAFMGVNLAALRHFSLPAARSSRSLANWCIPGAGFLFCLWIWCELPHAAKLAGLIWFAIGVCYQAILTKGFQRKPLPLTF